MVIISKTKHITKRGVVKRNPSTKTPKGWRKTYHYYGWGFEKLEGQTKGFIYISEKYISHKAHYIYIVDIYKSYFGTLTEKPNIKRYFPTKDKAMKYAINWMKKHPKG